MKKLGYSLIGLSILFAGAKGIEGFIGAYSAISNNQSSAIARLKDNQAALERKIENELEAKTRREWGTQGKVVACYILELPKALTYNDNLAKKIIDFEAENQDIGLFPAGADQKSAKPGSQIQALNVCERKENAKYATLDDDITKMLQGPAEYVGLTSPITKWKIAVPKINVYTSIVSVGLTTNGDIGTPDNPDVVGWYEKGPAPGQVGNVLLDGHVDWTDRITRVPRTGVFWDLKKLSNGDIVKFSDESRELTYIVREKYTFSANDRNAVSVLKPSNDAKVTLITCTGKFNSATRQYSHREVVVAYLAN